MSRLDIERGLASLGVSAPVEVHSSLSAFGYVEGGAEAVVDALVSVFPLVLVPSSTYESFAGPPMGRLAARNGLDAEALAHSEWPGVPFSPDMPVSREIGAVPEALRRRPGSARGSHPTQSFAAIGGGAADLVAAQTVDEPLAPIERLIDAGGWVLMLGTDFISCTAVHVAERRAGRRYFIRWSADAAGRVFPVRVSGCSRGFNCFEPLMAGIAREARIGAARVRAFPGKELLRIAGEAIRRDPHVTMCANRCSRCRDAARGGPLE